MAGTSAALRQRGAKVADTRVGGTKAILSDMIDPNGVRRELLEVPPESLTRKAMERWR